MQLLQLRGKAERSHNYSSGTDKWHSDVKFLSRPDDVFCATRVLIHRKSSEFHTCFHGYGNYADYFVQIMKWEKNKYRDIPTGK